MSEGFDPFASGVATYTGRPFRAARGEADGELSEEAGPAPGNGDGAVPARRRPATVAERLADLEDRLVLLEEGLAQLDRKTAARFDEQMARIVLTVAQLLGQRTGSPAESKPKRQSWPKIDW